jgi:CRP/FNR family cyclic AMP-dependent transcriptional regulator
MSEDFATLLPDIQLFAKLSPGSIAALKPLTRLTFTDGQVIMLQGETDTPIYFVLAGSVRIFRANAEGREQTLTRLQAGDTFNLPTPFSSSHVAPATAVAVGDVDLLAMSASDFRRVVSETPEIALAVLRDLSNRLQQFVELTHDLSLRSVRARLAGFLLSQTTAPDHERWTHEEMAARVGTVREVISRTIREFEKTGLLEMQRHRIVILDAAALQEIAES